MKLQFRTVEPPPGVNGEDWKSWTWQFKNGLTSHDQFSQYFILTGEEQRALSETKGLFQIRATPYYASLADRENPKDPLRRLMMPALQELSLQGQQLLDPLGEKHHSPRERLIHRYPDRVLFLVTDQCSVYCRYCTRKHFTGQDQAFVGSRAYQEALQYIHNNVGVREVILSGGDPLTLSNGRLEKVLADLRTIDHLEIIRIGTRMPVVAPMRIDAELARVLRKYKPVFLMTHFVHPKELTADAAGALEILVDNGVPVFNQMVLLNGINNHPAIVQALARRLLYLRVKPYYMFQCDPSEGTEHFRTSVEESLEIQRELWGRLSGLAMANLSLDIPGGGGKVGLVPNFEVGINEIETKNENLNLDSSPPKIHIYSGWDGFTAKYFPPTFDRELPADLNDYLAEWEKLKNQTYGRSEVRKADEGVRN